MPIREREERGEGWCILRTAGRHTLALAQSLAEDGYTAWAPFEVRTVVVPKMNARREVKTPMLAGFVFVRSTHLVDLLELAAMPVKSRRGPGLMKPAHAGFSVFHHFDRIPIIADSQLNHLRRIARRRSGAPKAGQSFKKYQRVRVEKIGDAFHGKTGVVQRSNERDSVVCFDGRWDVKISTFILTAADEAVARAA